MQFKGTRNMREYVTLSLETHLFFGRIMKEHSLFLLAGFPEKEKEFRRRADHVLREANHYLRLLEDVERGRC